MRLIAIVSLLCLAGCDEQYESKLKYADGNTDIICTKFSFSGHKYISFKTLGNYGSPVLHDPDCGCFVFERK